MPKIIQVKIWDKYNYLTIISKPFIKTRPNWCTYKRVECKCQCWTIKDYDLSKLRIWEIKSCWCMRWKLQIQTRWSHWKTNTKFYKVYAWIRSRCNTKSSWNYKNYWWRWIKCEWETYNDFEKDMFSTYKEWLSIDRIDVNWNYCKENCRWVTPKEQARNTRKTLYYKWKDLHYWIDELWLKKSTVTERIRVYWYSIEKALFWKCIKIWKRRQIIFWDREKNIMNKVIANNAIKTKI